VIGNAFRYTIVITLSAILLAGCGTTQEAKDDIRFEGERHLQEGNMHLAQGKLEMAMFELSKAERMIPKNPEVHFAIGTIFIFRDEPAMAVDKFKLALKLDPNHADAYNNLGYAYMELGRYDEAIRAANKAVDEVDYETPERAFTIIGWSSFKQGNTPEGIDYLKRALLIREDQPDTENKLATIYIEEGRLDKARAVLLPLVKRVPNFPQARLNMGIIYYKEKNRQAAAEEFKAVIKHADADSEEARLARGYLDLVE
jgi:type IV pilus biogenesis/stability protein PilW